MNDDRLTRFRALHERGMFLMPNPWDVGSATRLAERGFQALATTSSGFAWSLGKQDQEITLDELLTHAEALAAAVDVPLNVDAERCYADDLAGVARTVELLAATGAAGCSIEDYDPVTKTIDERAKAVDRVAAAAQSAHEHGLVLTARAENHLYGVGDLDDTIARLCAFRDTGAEVLYAPGLVDIAEIATVVREVARPINILRMKGAPSLADLAAAGVRRVSTGGSLARAAYATLRVSADEMLAAMPA